MTDDVVAGELSLEPVRPVDRNGTTQRWNAIWFVDGEATYDGTGETVEDALVDLVFWMGVALRDARGVQA